LYSFSGSDGRFPQAALVQGSGGTFFGTTALGGLNADNGTVFNITANGTFTSLFSFNGTNGSNPMASLAQGRDGNFYGTTAFGGAIGNNGTVFKITPSGVFTLLLSFTGTNGSGPAAGLVKDISGNFYGTTQFGGTNDDNGTIFRITPGGVLTHLFSFRGRDGNYPLSALALGNDGSFYGTTSGDRTFGGTNTFGTVFRITPAGSLTTLIAFNGANGACPVSGLARGTDGNFYGTTFLGGSGGGGTLFRLVEPPVVTGTAAAGGAVKLTWTAFANGRYRVESVPELTDLEWLASDSDVTATGNTISITNNLEGASLRFYRVRLLP
jgi:uncharacterized repeat protein (TIGR03803 family)